MAKKPKMFLPKFVSFGHYFWTRNTRKSTKLPRAL